jgi:hypothetical protein
MGKLIDEVREWNTPIVGAYLLWRFTKGYMNNHPNGDAPIAILHFIVSGILTNPEIYDAINGHKPDLTSFIRWFSEDLYFPKNCTFSQVVICVKCGLFFYHLR